MRSFEIKRPGESVTLAFDFSRDLPAGVTVASVGQTVVQVLRGQDANPGAVLEGAAVLDGVRVLQRVGGGVAGASYLLVATANFSDGQRRELPAVLPVRNLY